MPSERNYQAVAKPILSSVVFALFSARLPTQGASRIHKQQFEWTEQDAQQVLKSLAHDTEAVITSRLTQEQLREGGQMGQPQTIDNAGVDPNGSEYKIPPDMFNVFTASGADDRSLQFEAKIGRISVAHTYNLKEMQFPGKLEL
jgi:hypothetical protein